MKKLVVNDLQEAIARKLNQAISAGVFTYNKSRIYIKYLDKDDLIGFVPDPGSSQVGFDFSGLQRWKYNYEFTIRTKNRADAKNRLFEISQFLQSLNESKDLKSNNGSWSFDSLKVSSAPAETMEDLKGTVTYSMDVAVFVYRK